MATIRSPNGVSRRAGDYVTHAAEAKRTDMPMVVAARNALAPLRGPRRFGIDLARVIVTQTSSTSTLRPSAAGRPARDPNAKS